MRSPYDGRVGDARLVPTPAEPMTSETSDHPTDAEPSPPTLPRGRSQLSRAVAECRAYLHERELKRARGSATRRFTGMPIATSAAAQLIRGAWSILAWAGNAAIGVGTAVLSALAGPLPNGATLLRIVQSRSFQTVIGVCLLAVTGLYIANQMTKQHRHVVAIDRLVAQFRDLREQSAADDAWDAFIRQARQQLDEMVPELEAAAQAGDRESIDLLWAARDYFPKMLIDARNGPSEAERQFNVCMRRVRGREPSRE